MLDWLPIATRRESPNYSERDGFDICTVVLHYTAAGDGAGSISWLCDERSGVSAHFVIDRDGRTSQLVPLSKSAWHAGASEWAYKGKPKRGVNRYSVGIELCNHGPLFCDKSNRFWWECGARLLPYKQQGVPIEIANQFYEPYYEPQIKALIEVLDQLQGAGIDFDLCGHSHVAPIRKVDPGPVFPWHKLDQFKRLWV